MIFSVTTKLKEPNLLNDNLRLNIFSFELNTKFDLSFNEREQFLQLIDFYENSYNCRFKSLKEFFILLSNGKIS